MRIDDVETSVDRFSSVCHAYARRKSTGTSRSRAFAKRTSLKFHTHARRTQCRYVHFYADVRKSLGRVTVALPARVRVHGERGDICPRVCSVNRFYCGSTRSSFSFAINVVVFGVFDPVAAAHLMSGRKTMTGGRTVVYRVCACTTGNPQSPPVDTRFLR